MITSPWLLPAVLLFTASAAYGSEAFAEAYTAANSGTTHTVTQVDFELSGAGLPHSCAAVICPGYERENTSDLQFVKYEISTSTVADGDTVVFADGTYELDGPIVIRHTGLMISSDDGDGVTIRSTDNKGLVFRNVGDVSGLVIRGLDMESADTTRLAPARNFGMIFIEDTAGHDGIRILDNTFRGDKQNGIRIGSSDRSSLFTNVEIRDNTFETIPVDRIPVYLSNAEVTLFANTFERSDYVRLDGAGSLADLYNVYPGKPDRAPSVTAPPPVELEATGPLTAVTPERLGIATARDDRDQSPVITNDSPGSFAVGNHTVTWTATDSAGNSRTAGQLVTIRDTTPPAITLPANIKVTVEMGVTHEELLSAIAATCTDLVDGDLPITSNGVVDTDTPGEYVVVQSCTDAAGNPASVTRTVTVVVPPPLRQPTDLGIVSSYDMGNGWRMMTINWTEPAQPPASGYEVTVTGSNGTLLPLSQFEFFTASNQYQSYNKGVTAYNMDGSRNMQDDIVENVWEITWGLDIHDNVIYTNPGNGTVISYNLDGTHNRTIAIGNIRGEGIAIHDDKAWMYDRVGGDWHLLSFDLSTGNPAGTFVLHENTSPFSVGELDGILYVVDIDDYIHAYGTDGTYLPSKSFEHDGNALGISAEDTTGTLWVYDTGLGHMVHVYSSADDSGTPHLFSLDIKRPIFRPAEHIALTTPATSDTITVPAGTNSTAYYYHAPDETVMHTVQLATSSSEPPATIQTRGDYVIVPPVQVFYDTFDSSLGMWTYQDRPYGSLNTMFCGADDAIAAYSLMLSSDNGGSAHMMNKDICWLGLAGASRTFDVPARHGGGDLSISLDYRTRADFDNQTIGGHVNNLFYAITDSDGDDLDNGSLFLGERHKTEDDSHWDTATIIVHGLEAFSCPCEITVYTADLGWDVYNKRFSIDNVNATMTMP